MAPSVVWTYFKKTGNGDKVICTICEKEFKFKNSTSTLRNHLESVHKLQISQKNSDRKRSVSNSIDIENDACDDSIPRKKQAALSTSGALVPVNALIPVDLKSTSTYSISTIRQSSFNGPLDKCFTNTASFSAGGYRHVEATSALLYMIVQDNLSLSTPEKKGFRLFVQKLQPLYRPPCEPTLTKALEFKYTELKLKIKNELAHVNSVCLTSDIWTHNYTMQGYIGVTAHYLKGSEMVSVELGAYLMENRKNIANIRTELRNIYNDWGISDEKISAVVTDSGANIKGAVKQEFGEEKHISCFGHKFNNIGHRLIEMNITVPPSESATNTSTELPENEDDMDDLDADNGNENSSLRHLLLKVKRIVRFFRTSEVASTELKKIQLQEKPEAPALKLINEVKTRWNSCYDMLERFLKLADPVSRVLFQIQRDKSSRAKPPSMLSSEDLEALTEVRDLLKILNRVTHEVSAEKCVTISKCIPIVKGILNLAEKFNASTPISYNLKEKLIAEINNQFCNIENVEVYAFATLLDPRYKKKAFQCIRGSARAVTHAGKLIRQEVQRSNSLNII